MVLIIYQKNTAYAGDDAKSVPVQKTHLSIISFDSGHDSDTKQKTMAIVGTMKFIGGKHTKHSEATMLCCRGSSSENNIGNLPLRWFHHKNLETFGDAFNTYRSITALARAGKIGRAHV